MEKNVFGGHCGWQQWHKRIEQQKFNFMTNIICIVCFPSTPSNGQFISNCESSCVLRFPLRSFLCVCFYCYCIFVFCPCFFSLHLAHRQNSLLCSAKKLVKKSFSFLHRWIFHIWTLFIEQMNNALRHFKFAVIARKKKLFLCWNRFVRIAEQQWFSIINWSREQFLFLVGKPICLSLSLIKLSACLGKQKPKSKP